MNTLPVELCQHILAISLDVHPSPSNILRVSKEWNGLVTPVLHGNIKLRSLTQLYFFSTTARLVRPPKSFSLRLPGGFGHVHFTGTAGEGTITSEMPDKPEKPDEMTIIKMKIVDKGGIWGCLKTALQICSKVERVVLQLHSFVSDPNLVGITSSLGVINPQSFIWTGPDPDHHLSTAIVAPATEYFFRAIKSWSNLEHLVLTNIKFPAPPASSILCSVFAFQTHSRLREIRIGQAVALKPEDIAAMVLNIPSLRTLTLEDAYVSSIWGARIRDSDITKAFSHLSEQDPRRERLSEVVKCTVRLERIVGGDRG